MVLWITPRTRGRRWLAFGMLLTPALALLWDGERPVTLGGPRLRAAGTTVSSGACKACHPAEYASWSRSYHRTMTRPATGANILAPAGRHSVALKQESVVLEHDQDALWITMPDPVALALSTAGPIPTIREQAVLTTGSHHYQAYWVAGARIGELRAAPVVWHIEAERFIPRHDVFLQPPDSPDQLVRWNSNCLVCHSTLAEPRHDDARDTFDTTVTELGIACEACHGAGGLHAGHYADPWARWAARNADEAKHITQPEKLSKARASEVCGQCHSYALPKDEAEWWTSGYARSYAPGAALADSRTVIDEAELASGSGVIEASAESLFWGDGTIRVGGREYNGLSASACFLRGEGDSKLGCGDCHQLHGDDPVDQLKPKAHGNGVCNSCHVGFDQPQHTRHAVGALCYSCHMPKVSYALYAAQRSHRVDVPSVEVAVQTGRPPACNLCHLDKTLGWTAEQLTQNWGIPSAAPAVDDRALGVKLALRGDAATRVIVADHLLSAEAVAACGDDFQLPLLATLLADPYSAVRYVAGRELTQAGLLDKKGYDFLGTEEHFRQVASSLLATWAERSHRDNAAVLHPGGTLDAPALANELKHRDDRPIWIAE
jgi:hypothetical protein